MQLKKDTAEIWIPDGLPVDEGLARTTHLGISAHQDDLEIMAMDGILAGFGKKDKWFTGVVVTNGAGSARDDIYANYTDDEMRAIRRIEQKKAAFIGEYSAAVFLDFSSGEVRDPQNPDASDDLKKVLLATRPEVVYVHNLADKHPTHIGTAMSVIRAIRALPKEQRPGRIYGCEVWRDLDWMVDADKEVFRLDKHENIQASLVGVFDSQVVGGKRYDLATIGRRRAHATYHESHSVDQSSLINFGMNLTPLIEDDTLDIVSYVKGYIERFGCSVEENLRKFL